MNAPKNRQSDDRNSHIASLALVTPVWRVVRGSWRGVAGRLGGSRSASRGRRDRCCVASHQCLRPCSGLEAPREHAEQEQHEPGIASHGFVEHRRVAEERQPERRATSG